MNDQLGTFILHSIAYGSISCCYLCSGGGHLAPFYSSDALQRAEKNISSLSSVRPSWRREKQQVISDRGLAVDIPGEKNYRIRGTLQVSICSTQHGARCFQMGHWEGCELGADPPSQVWSSPWLVGM